MTSRLHLSISRAMSRAVASPSFTMKFAWVGDTRALPSRDALESRAVDQCTRRCGNARWGCESRAGSGFWKMHPALAASSGWVRLRNASDSRATARSAAGRRLAGTEVRRDDDLAGAMQPAVVIAELHVSNVRLENLAVRADENNALNQFAR